MAVPRYILSPFFLSAMLTMCNINRFPESKSLSSSSILPFLRNAIRNVEIEKEMWQQSAWCHDALGQAPLNLDKIMNLLIDQR